VDSPPSCLPAQRRTYRRRKCVGQGRGPSDLARANHQVGIERMVPVGRGVTAGTELVQPVHRGGRVPGQRSQPLRRRHGGRREDDPPRFAATKVIAHLAVNGFPQPCPPIGTATVARQVRHGRPIRNGARRDERGGHQPRHGSAAPGRPVLPRRTRGAPDGDTMSVPRTPPGPGHPAQRRGSSRKGADRHPAPDEPD
jgi:hypothetical protein